jgi:hypothetical protein
MPAAAAAALPAARLKPQYIGRCCVCDKHQNSLYAHLKMAHPDHHYTDEEVAQYPYGFVACSCGIVCVSELGRKFHLSKAATAHAQRTIDREVAIAAAAAGGAAGGGGEGEAAQNPEAEHRRLFELPGIEAPLEPHQVLLFATAAHRVAQAYIDNPTDRRLFDVLALVKVGARPKLTEGKGRFRSFRTRLEQYPLVRVPEPPPPREPRAPAVLNRRVQRQVRLGHLKQAARVLTSATGMAKPTAETVERLTALHPEGPIKPFGDAPGPACRAKITFALVKKALQSFDRETAPGVSGWTVDLIQLLVDDENKPFARFLVLLCQQIALGSAPGRHMLLASRLLASEKAGGGVRPLAVGELFYRLAGKTLLASSFDPTVSLLPSQLGVGTKGGVEPMLRVLARAIAGTLPDRYSHYATIDLTNAFNLMDREAMAMAVAKHAPQLWQAARWAYGEASLLYCQGPEGTVELASRQGSKQGDPLGGVLFSIALRPVLEELLTTMGPTALPLFYFDDGGIARTDAAGYDKVIDVFRRNERRGFCINVDKSRLHELSPQLELETLGSYVGPRPEEFLRRRIQEEIAHLGKLVDLPAQDALLLLRTCLQQRLRHLLRTLPDVPAVREVWQTWDRNLRRAVLRMRGARTAEEGHDRVLIELPLRYGGIGIASHEETARHAVAAAAQASDALIATIIPAFEDDVDEACTLSQRERVRPDVEAKATHLFAQLSPAQRLRNVDARTTFSRQWLHAIPRNAYTMLSKEEIAVGLSERTLVTGHHAACVHCAQSNALGHDEVCQQRRNWRTARHESGKKAIAYAARTVEGTTVTVEDYVADRRRRTDLRITGPASYQQASSDYDLTVVSLHAQGVAGPEGGGDGDALLQETREVIKRYLDDKADAKTAIYAQHTPSAFHPIVFSAGGSMSTSTKQVFDFWRTVMSRSCYDKLLLNFGITLLRSRSRAFVL